MNYISSNNFITLFVGFNQKKNKKTNINIAIYFQSYVCISYYTISP